MKFDLLVMLHLMGDLQMPLHTGYEDDLGGNKRMVQYDTLKTHNLHWFWDEYIIKLGNITEADHFLSGLARPALARKNICHRMLASYSLPGCFVIDWIECRVPGDENICRRIASAGRATSR